MLHISMPQFLPHNWMAAWLTQWYQVVYRTHSLSVWLTVCSCCLHLCRSHTCTLWTLCWRVRDTAGCRDLRHGLKIWAFGSLWKEENMDNCHNKIKENLINFNKIKVIYFFKWLFSPNKNVQMNGAFLQCYGCMEHFCNAMAALHLRQMWSAY